MSTVSLQTAQITRHPISARPCQVKISKPSALTDQLWQYRSRRWTYLVGKLIRSTNCLSCKTDAVSSISLLQILGTVSVSDEPIIFRPTSTTSASHQSAISTWKPPSASDPRMSFGIGDVGTDPLDARVLNLLHSQSTTWHVQPGVLEEVYRPVAFFYNYWSARTSTHRTTYRAILSRPNMGIAVYLLPS